MFGNNNKPKQAKKCYTGSLSEEEIEKQLSLIFDTQICPECGQDHGFKNSFEDVKTSINDFLKHIGNKIPGRAISIVIGGDLER